MWPKKSIWKEEAAPRLLWVQNLPRSKDAPIFCLTWWATFNLSSYSWKHVGKQVGCAAIPVTKAEDMDSKDDKGRWGAAGDLCADGQTSSLDLLIPYLWWHPAGSLWGRCSEIKKTSWGNPCLTCETLINSCPTASSPKVKTKGCFRSEFIRRAWSAQVPRQFSARPQSSSAVSNSVISGPAGRPENYRVMSGCRHQCFFINTLIHK